MTLYLVTKLSQEESNTGTILRVDSLVHGLFTSQTHAQATADKYGGTVTPLVEDQEKRLVVQSWENPGYVQS